MCFGYVIPKDLLLDDRMDSLRDFLDKLNPGKGGSVNDIRITHNHIGNSALSPQDILTPIQNNLKELRAVGSDGVTYSLKRKKVFSIDDTPKKIFDKVNNIMDSEYPKLKE